MGWMVQLPDDPEHPDIFQLNNPDKGRQQVGHRAPGSSSNLPHLLFCQASGASRLLHPCALGLGVACYALTRPWTMTEVSTEQYVECVPYRDHFCGLAFSA